MNDIALTRRHLLAALAATAVLPSAAFAATSPAAAEAMVNKMVAEVQKAINSGQSESRMIKDFEALFKRYADVPTIARFSLGVAARSASSSELRAYTNAFTGYFSRKYGRRFNEFKGGTVKVVRARADKKVTVVDAVAKVPGHSDVKVEFHVSDGSGSDKVFNVIIEGINMLTTERTEIGALLDKSGGSISRLTQTLKNT
ncbi:MlaC/ttg2D family ABC transporter substrate-binding protein [Fluviibacterium sp. S390]|uniref:MlaC/ttg2D family ABC transporter substrate-binding protein n=1 Tax=Fluviibacterium sp. S390 TaxID=3415139 RepID=UPI003C7C801D